jgi:hypothetical protein
MRVRRSSHRLTQIIPYPVSLRPESESERKAFFFEKKKQKTFICFGFGFSGWAQPSEQKFFGSFFQKRTASFA